MRFSARRVQKHHKFVWGNPYQKLFTKNKKVKILRIIEEGSRLFPVVCRLSFLSFDFLIFYWIGVARFCVFQRCNWLLFVTCYLGGSGAGEGEAASCSPAKRKFHLFRSKVDLVREQRHRAHRRLLPGGSFPVLEQTKILLNLRCSNQ